MKTKKSETPKEKVAPQTAPERRVRADAQRNIEALLQAAMAVFLVSGVDAPVREIAEKAGVGIGTIYRHFPQRADLITAVFKHEVDACAEAAPILAAKHQPGEALSLWIERYAGFIATKRGLAKALHSGDPAYDGLHAYFQKWLSPAFRGLLDAAIAAGEVRPDANADDLLDAIAHLSRQATEADPDRGRRMVALLIDGLRYGAELKGKKK